MMVTAALGALALREFDEAASVAFLFSVSDESLPGSQSSLEPVLFLGCFLAEKGRQIPG